MPSTPFFTVSKRLLASLLVATLLAATSWACSSPTAEPAADSAAASDTAVTDSTADTPGLPDAAPEVSANQLCCQNAKAECGFAKGCASSCGTCPSTATCKANLCVPKPVYKKLGEGCGPDATCRPPANNAEQALFDEYWACLDAQCESGRCYLGICTDACTLTADKVVNASGAAGQDGVEDPGAKGDCADSSPGPFGAELHCVEQLKPADVAKGKSSAVCMAGTTFGACKGNSDCASSEACAIRYILGAYTTACVAKAQNPGAKPAGTYSQFCNGDPQKGEVAQCDNNHCSTAGTCLAFCKSDVDCVTSPGACQGGKCAGSGAACQGDVDCSAAECVKDQKFYSNVATTFDLCRARKCATDSECKDSGFFCRNWYNGVKDIGGDPDPADPTKTILPAWDPGCVRKLPGTAKKGEACDPYTSDSDTSLPPCQNPTFCSNGSCGGLCKADGDCSPTQKCGVQESSFDLSEPADGLSDWYLPAHSCQPMPGAKGACLSGKDCKDPAAPYCRPWEYALDLPAGATASAYATGGLCISPESQYVDDLGACGLQVGGKLCKSGVCLGTNGGDNAGFCGQLCSSSADCPATMSWDGGTYKSVCRSYFRAWGGTAEPEDDLYLPFCGTASKASSLVDCAATKKCSDPKEYCAPLAVAFGPDQPVKMEFKCMTAWTSTQTPGTKKPGEACNPNPASGAPAECASGYSCRQDAKKGEGYCIAPCNTDADCGLAEGVTPTDGLICDTGHMFIARKDKAAAGIAPFCLKKKACLPCKWDTDCTGDFRCTNLGGSWDSSDRRCAAPCGSDADCGGVSGACAPPVGLDGKALAGPKVCKPSCAAP